MGKSRAYEEIDDDAADRIISAVDTTGDWYDVRKRLVKRFLKWTAYQRDRMSSRILDRRIEVEEFEKGKITKKYTQIAVDQAIGVGGTKKARYKVVKDLTGKYLGREGNIRVVTRVGTKVYAKNLRTGRIARIK